jgi:hypothetical protein
VPERDHLRAIEDHLRREEPDLARSLDAFTSATAVPRDLVPRGVAAALFGVSGLLLAGWAGTGDPGLLTGAALVLASTPVAWLVRLARRPVPGT